MLRSLLCFLIGPVVVTKLIPLLLREFIFPLIVFVLSFSGGVRAFPVATADLSSFRTWRFKILCFCEFFALVFQYKQIFVRSTRLVYA